MAIPQSGNNEITWHQLLLLKKKHKESFPFADENN